MRLFTLGLATFLLAGCEGNSEPGIRSDAAASGTTAVTPAEEIPADSILLEALPEDPVAGAAREALEERADEFLASVEDLREQIRSLFPETPPRAGSWLDCEGYRTNNASAGFCEDAPPPDWRPFEFQGRQYFVVPLGE